MNLIESENGIVNIGLVCDKNFDVSQFIAISSLYLKSRNYEIFPRFDIKGIVLNGVELPAELTFPLSKTVRYQNISELIQGTKDLDMILFAGHQSQILPEMNGVLCMHVESLASFTETLIKKLTNDGIFKQTDRIFGNIVDQLEDEFLVLTPNGIILNINKAAINNIGGQKADYIGKNFRNLEGRPFSPAEDFQPCPVEESISKKKSLVQKLASLTADGSIRYFRVNVIPIFSERGAIVRVFFMRRDVTQDVSLEQQDKIKERLATEMTLLHQLTHEVRNPLFVIGGFASSLLRSKDLSPVAKEKAQAILEESRRIDELMSRLSDAIKPISPKLSSIEINETLNNVLNKYKESEIEAKLTFKTDFYTGLPRAHGDPDLFFQCVVQLIDNAMKATPSDGTIILRSRQIENVLKVQVIDNGIGMSAEQCTQLFNPLLRPQREGGGLIRVKKAMEEMGGNIYIQSMLTKGTTATLTLKPIAAQIIE